MLFNYVVIIGVIALLILYYLTVRNMRNAIDFQRQEATIAHEEISQLRIRMQENVTHYTNELDKLEKDIAYQRKLMGTATTRHQAELDALELAHKNEVVNLVAETDKNARADALKRSAAVSHGFSSENFAPLLQGEWNHKDFRHMGDPVDFMIIAGMDEVRHGKDTVDEIVLLDIKTGKAQLNKIQRRIRDAVAEGRVTFATYNTDTQELRTWPERPESSQTKFDWED